MYIWMGLILFYSLLLLFNTPNIGLFAGDESLYHNSIFTFMEGNIDNVNHPLLAKSVWYFIVSIYYILTGSDTFLIWRLGNALFSLGVLIVFFKIARLFFTRVISFVAVLLLALDPMYFSFSHILQPDIPMMFFFLLSLYWFLRFVQEKKTKFFYLSGLFLGLCFATKMSPLFVLPIVSIALFVIFTRSFRRPALLYLIFLIAAFTLGNFLFFFKASQFNFFQYVYALFASQVHFNFTPEGYLTSPPWSWFTIPQILTVYRVLDGDRVQAIFAFQNPVFFALTIPVLIVSSYQVIKKRSKEIISIAVLIAYFFAIYIPLFLNLHATYYYYVLPLVPLVILLTLRIVLRLGRISKYILGVVIFTSIVHFIVYYPMLVGLTVPKKYELTLFSYSLYRYPDSDTLFCQYCSPRK